MGGVGMDNLGDIPPYSVEKMWPELIPWCHSGTYQMYHRQDKNSAILVRHCVKYMLQYMTSRTVKSLQPNSYNGMLSYSITLPLSS